MTALDLDNHAIRVFPAGIFDPLKSSLTELSIAYNQTQASDSLMTLPAGLFTGFTNLTTLRLEHNDLETLPDGIFEELTNLTTLTLSGNPGSATFLPVAVAGPEGGIDANPGEEEVKLGGDAGGPWGNNLVYSWRKATGTTVDPSATDEAGADLDRAGARRGGNAGVRADGDREGHKPDRDGQRDGAGRGGTAAVTAVALSSTPIADSTYKLGETIQAVVGFSKPVIVTGTPQLALSVGANTRNADYVEGSSGVHPAGVRIHRGGGRRRHRRHRDRREQPDARDGRRDRRCRWHAGDSRPRRAGGAGRPQGGPGC